MSISAETWAFHIVRTMLGKAFAELRCSRLALNTPDCNLTHLGLSIGLLGLIQNNREASVQLLADFLQRYWTA